MSGLCPTDPRVRRPSPGSLPGKSGAQLTQRLFELWSSCLSLSVLPLHYTVGGVLSPILDSVAYWLKLPYTTLNLFPLLVGWSRWYGFVCELVGYFFSFTCVSVISFVGRIYLFILWNVLGPLKQEKQWKLSCQVGGRSPGSIILLFLWLTLQIFTMEALFLFFDR